MKNRLLALMALCGATSSTMPLWASENWPDPALTFVDPNLTQDETGGGVYYIYHVATEKFMTNGDWKNNWKTELVVGDEGQEMTLTYGNDYELSRRPQSDEEYTDAKGWRISMMNGPTNGGYHELFIREASMAICVDHNKQGHILWKIVSQGNGMYRIKMLDEDSKYGVAANDGMYKNAYMGVNEGETGVNPVMDINVAGYENGQLDWKFVAPEAYAVFKAKKKLQAQLDAADEAGFTEISTYAALYKSVDATAEEVEAATEELSTKVLEFKYGSASEQSPADLTAKIKNASFESADGWTTWSATTNDSFKPVTKAEGEIATSDNSDFRTFFERWTKNAPNGDWYVEQELADLPDGKYRLGAYIMSQMTEEQGGPKALSLYAKTGLGEMSKVADVPSPNGGTYAAPYSVEFSVVGGKATVGMRSEGYEGNWCGVGYFTLQYMGKSGAVSVRDMLQKNIEDAETKYAEYVGSNERFSLSGQEKYETDIKFAKEALGNTELDNDSLMGVIAVVQQRMDSLALDIAAYRTLDEKYNALSDKYEEDYENKEIYLDSYEEYLTQLEDGLNNKTFDPSEVDSIQPRADRILRQAVLESLQSPDGMRDATGLFTNMDFSNGTNGWAKEGSGDFKHSSAKICELWNARRTDGVVSQELSGLPSGSYKITMQGFYSPSSSNANGWQQGWGQEGDVTNDVLGYLFANDASVKLHHVMDSPLTEEEKGTASRYEQITFTDDPRYKDKWLVRSVAAAAETFANFPDRYINEVVCYVGEDGKLRLGVKAATASHDWLGTWIVMDNFKVEYLGADDMSGATVSMEALIAQAAALRDKEVLTTQEAKDGLDEAIEAANKVLAEGLTLEVYNEHVAALNAAIEAGQDAIDAATALETKNDNHNNKLTSTGEGSYDAYIDTEGFAELEEVVLKIEEKIKSDGIFASMEEIDGYNVELNKAYTKMVSGIIDFSTATKDAPVDATSLIINPGFQTQTFDENTQQWKDVSSAEGWTATGGNATSGLNYEIYNDSCEIHQMLYNMPAGYYRIVYDGLYRAGDITPAALSRRDGEEPLNAKVFLDGKESKWNKEIVSIFENISEYKYTTGDKTVADSLLTPKEEGMLYHFIINNVSGAKAAFEEGVYEGNFSFRVEEGEEPVLGVRKIAKVQNDWTCFDNFRLYYLGDGDANRPDDIDDALDTNIDEVVTDGKATVVSSAWYTVNGVRVAEPKQRGIYIRRDKMSDGTVKAVKVMMK